MSTSRFENKITKPTASAQVYARHSSPILGFAVETDGDEWERYLAKYQDEHKHVLNSIQCLSLLYNLLFLLLQSIQTTVHRRGDGDTSRVEY